MRDIDELDHERQHTIWFVRLWTAVLNRSVLDLVDGTSAQRADAVEWFLDDERSACEIGSFAFVCDVLDLSPAYVRAELRRRGLLLRNDAKGR